MAKKTSVYSADVSARVFSHIFVEMFQGVKKGRYLAYRLFQKDIKGEYANSALGVIWDFLEPVVWAVLFIQLYKTRTFEPGAISIDIQYPVFVVVGLMLWQTFLDSLTLPLSLIKRSKNLILHQQVPPEALLLSLFYRICFFSTFRILILETVAICYGNFSLIGFSKFLLLYPMIILAGYSFGVFFAPFSVIYADIGRIINIISRPLMFASPVLWATPALPYVGDYPYLNPAGTMISGLRSLIVQNSLVNPLTFFCTCAGLIIVFFVGWFIFHMSIPILADKS